MQSDKRNCSYCSFGILFVSEENTDLRHKNMLSAREK